MKLTMQVGLGLATLCYMGPAPPPQKAAEPPQVSAHVYCGQTAGWIKMPLGTEVRLGDIVLHEDTAPLPLKRDTRPIFGRCLYCGQTAGWIKICHFNWYGGTPRPRPHCVTWGLSSPRGAQQPNPSFRPMSRGQTVAHLSHF